MLPKENRLVEPYDFRRVGRLGRRYQSPFFSLTVAPQKQTAPPRFGFVVSTRIDKRAAVRNRIKRLLREAVHARLDSIPNGFDLVFATRPNIKGKSYEEVCSAVNQVLSKISFARSGLG